MNDDYKVREWWMVRHAPVKTKGLIYGHLDLEADFSDTGRLGVLAEILPRVATIITSDLARCRDTARKILDHQSCMNSQLNERVTLREQYFGRWEGKTYMQAEMEDQAAYNSFFKDPASSKPKEGESFQELIERVKKERDALLHSVSSQDIILFTHAGVIRAMVGLALDMDPQKMLSLKIDPLSLTHLTSFQKEGETSWRVNFLNDLNRN